MEEPAAHDLEPLGLIVAMTRGRVIGRAGSLPWYLPEDLKHFRKITTGHAILMGRRTYDSIGRPLPKRRNIVITRQPEFVIEGCEVVHSLGQAIALARSDDPQPIVIGGAAIFAEALPLTTVMYITWIEGPYEGDTFFPAWDENVWELIERRDSPPLVFETRRRMYGTR